MLKGSQKLLFVIFGWVFVALGAIGALLPLIPTTPFLILAAFCFSKGSERMHHWLLNLPAFGPSLREWEEHHVIRPKAKALATLMIIMLFGTSFYFAKVGWIIKTILVAIGAAVLTFIWTRKSAPSTHVASHAERI